MPNLPQVQKLVQKKLERSSIESERQAWTGRLRPDGSLDNNILVTGQPNQIYIRFAPADRDITIAWNINNAVANIANVPIRVRLDESGAWEVVGVNSSLASASYGAAASSLLQTVVPAELNQQPTLIRNIQSVKASPLSGFSWMVWAGFVQGRYFSGNSITIPTLPTSGNELISYVGINPNSFELSTVNSAEATIGTYDVTDVDGSALGANIAPLAYAIIKYGASSLLECEWDDLRSLIGQIGSSSDAGFPYHVTSAMTIREPYSVVVQGELEIDAGVELTVSGRLTVLS